MRIYWIKAQAPRRVLALIKYLGMKAEFEEVDMMAGEFKTPDYVALNPNMKAPWITDWVWRARLSAVQSPRTSYFRIASPTSASSVFACPLIFLSHAVRISGWVP